MFEVVMFYGALIVVGFLTVLVLWLRDRFESLKFKVRELENEVIDRIFEVNSLRKQCRFLEELLNSVNNETREVSSGEMLTSLTPKEVKLIKQYLHPDKHNGKSSEIYTKVVGLLSKGG